ncbi:Hypothetical predicted protein [Mytilus galloprovincialis]|uniref:Uncharacterized protein n=1 Tax=Mytilus galloprovincialis TaxID=29158 RepID=A0A8B6DS78_MYTGA|nr:Hypothetical predicted protein [Mytilus galloprovincialis]
MRIDVSIVCLCAMFARGVAQLNVVKREYFTTKYGRILPSSTTLIQQKTQSVSACVYLCSIHKACCVASYDRKTQQCNLDKSCCPESEQSADAQMLKIRTVLLQCPKGWLKKENKCYYFSNELNTWADAKVCTIAFACSVTGDTRQRGSNIELTIAACSSMPKWAWP